VSDPIRRPFTSKEFDLCIEYMAKNDRALYLCTILLGYLAIRPGEERNLKVGAFDFQRGLVRSPARNSKNNKDSNVTIPADILPMLENFGLKSYPEGYYVFGKAQGWHNVQLTPAPERIGENTLAHRFRVAIAELKKQGKLNNTKGLELHSLKDTLALYLLNNGVDVVSAMHHIWQNSLEVFQWYIKRLGVVNEKIRSLPVRALP
jgi:integrase